MSDDEQPPPNERQQPDRQRVNPVLVRNLLIAFAIIALGFGFGRPLAAGYYFGGCDHAEDTQHYVIHVFGVEMCRDTALASPAERSAQREAEATSAPELFEGESAPSPEESAPASAPGKAANS
jgi:hypothetical protein